MMPKFRAFIKLENAVNPMQTVAKINFEKESVTIEQGLVFKFNDVELMQSTGLKDKNGVKIFEGDILKIINLEYGEETFGQVVWGLNYQLCGNYPAFFVPEFESEMNSFAEIFDTGNYLVEIIGNIHQDPELLEVTK